MDKRAGQAGRKQEGTAEGGRRGGGAPRTGVLPAGPVGGPALRPQEGPGSILLGDSSLEAVSNLAQALPHLAALFAAAAGGRAVGGAVLGWREPRVGLGRGGGLRCADLRQGDARQLGATGARQGSAGDGAQRQDSDPRSLAREPALGLQRCLTGSGVPTVTTDGRLMARWTSDGTRLSSGAALAGAPASTPSASAAAAARVSGTAGPALGRSRPAPLAGDTCSLPPAACRPAPRETAAATASQWRRMAAQTAWNHWATALSRVRTFSQAARARPSAGRWAPRELVMVGTVLTVVWRVQREQGAQLSL